MVLIFFSSFKPLEMMTVSKKARSLSINIANKQAGTAPKNINLEFKVAIPLKIGSPRPPAPIKAAKVAVPTTMTAEVLTPAKNHR